jgi:hypothetical protein
VSFGGQGSPVARTRRRACRRASGALLLPLLLLSSSPVAARGDNDVTLPPSVEYQIKADFVYTVAKFVDWPEGSIGAPGTPLRFGIVGSDEAGEAIAAALRGRKVHERPLVVQTITDLKHLPECQIVYVAESSGAGVRSVLSQIGSTGILTIGETPDFAQSGGILGLHMRDTLVQFEVNIEAARHAGITISSKILRLGGVVGGASDASEMRR